MKGSTLYEFGEETCWPDGQKYYYMGLWLSLTAPVRLEIVVDDSVPRQSSAIAYVFSRNQMRWNELASIPWPDMCSHDTISHRVFGENLDIKHFNTDKVTLMAQARTILGTTEGGEEK